MASISSVFPSPCVLLLLVDTFLNTRLSCVSVDDSTTPCAVVFIICRTRAFVLPFRGDADMAHMILLIHLSIT